MNENLTQSQIEHEMVQRHLAQRHLRNFIPYTFPKYKPRPHNILICDAVDLAVSGKIKRLMVTIPPQYGKSEIVSRRTPPYVLGRDPDRKIMLVSYGANLAVRLSREARDTMYSDLYSNVFGARSDWKHKVTVSKKSRSTSFWQVAGKYKGSLLASGLSGALTGSSSDLTIIDDPFKDEEEAMSETIREKVWDWYWTSLYTRLSPDATIILVMTRWHEDDLAGRLLATQFENDEYWYILRMPAIAEDYEMSMRWLEENHVQPEYNLTREKVDRMLADEQLYKSA